MARMANINFDDENNNNSYGTTTYEECCHQQLYSSCIHNDLNKPLSKYLSIIINNDFELIDNRLCVSIDFDIPLNDVDKYFFLSCNHPKGKSKILK